MQSVESVVVGQSYCGSVVVPGILLGIPSSFLVLCKTEGTVGPSEKPRDGDIVWCC